MRVSRTRFSKRRIKRKTEFPIVAVVQKKRKIESIGNTKGVPSKSLAFGILNNQTEATKQQKKSASKPQKKSHATIDYKNVILLRNLITAEGKILPRRINKLTAKQQRNVQKAIKSARIIGLIPFINKSRPF